MNVNRAPVIAVDFDKTLADYDGWKGQGVFGAIKEDGKWVLKLLRQAGCHVIIWTTRTETDELAEYLGQEGVPFNRINTQPFSAPDNIGPNLPCFKIIADVYIDDRAIRFTSWTEALAKLYELGYLSEDHLELDLPEEQKRITWDYDAVVQECCEKYGEDFADETRQKMAFWTFNALPEMINAITIADAVHRGDFNIKAEWLYKDQEPGQLARAHVLTTLQSVSGWLVPPGLRRRARAHFLIKNHPRASTFLEAGVTGSLCACYTKLGRLRKDTGDEDSLVDLFNYAVFAMICANKGRLTPRKEPIEP